MRVNLAIVEASAGTPLPGSPRSGSPPASAITLTSWPLGAACSSVHLEICLWFTSLINKQLGCHGGICSVSRFPARETALRPGRLGFLSCISDIWVVFLTHSVGENILRPAPPPCRIVRMLPLLMTDKVAWMSDDDPILLFRNRCNFQLLENFTVGCVNSAKGYRGSCHSVCVSCKRSYGDLNGGRIVITMVLI